MMNLVVPVALLVVFFGGTLCSYGKENLKMFLIAHIDCVRWYCRKHNNTVYKQIANIVLLQENVIRKCCFMLIVATGCNPPCDPLINKQTT